MPLPALLMAQGMIPRQDVSVGTSKGPRVNDMKRTREDALPGPSKRHAGPAVKKEAMSSAAQKRTRQDALPGPSERHAGPAIKKEAMSSAAREQRIRELQVSRDFNGFITSRF